MARGVFRHPFQQQQHSEKTYRGALGFNWDASDSSSLLTSGATVTTIQDVSGSGYNADFLQGTPKYDATINGLNSIRFNVLGSEGLFYVGGHAFTLPLTVFHVFQLTSTSQTDGIILSSNGHADFRINGGQYEVQGGTRFGTVDLNPHVACTVFNGASSEFYLDGLYMGSFNAGGTTAPSIIGMGGDGGGPPHTVTGSVGQQVGFEGLQLTLREVTNQFQVLMQKWQVPVLDLDASVASQITSSGGAVSAWNAGNVTFSQSTGANKPTTGTRTIGGLNAIDFDGSTDYLQTSIAPQLIGPTTVFAVLKSDNAAALAQAFFGSSAAMPSLYTNSSLWVPGSPGNEVGAGTVDTNPHVISIVMNGANSGAWVDGVSITSSNLGDGSTTGPNAWTVGANLLGTVNWDGLIAEIIVYPYALATGARQTKEAALTTKWIPTSTSASAGLASGTGAASNATTKVSPTPSAATGTGTANNASTSIKTTAGLATGDSPSVISASNKTAEAEPAASGSQQSITTDSVSFTAGNLYLLTLRARDDNHNWVDIVWTVSGTGTWTEVNRVTEGDDSKRGSIMWRFACTSNTSGTVTVSVDIGYTAQIWTWVIDEIVGTDNNGTNGANALVQSATGSLALGDSSPFLVTLGSFSSANNATYGAFNYAGGALTQGSGFTSLGFAPVVTGDGVRSEFKATNDTTVDMTFSGTGTRATAIAVELKAGGQSGQAYNSTISTATVTNASPSAASGTGAASNATTSIKPSIAAATGTGTASNPGGTASASISAATGTGAAGAASASLKPNSGAGTGTGASGAPTSNVQPSAVAATGTGTASNPGGTASASINVATGTGTASNPASNVKPNASAAAGTGTASNAVGTLSASINAATGTGSAGTASTSLSSNSGAGTGTGASGAPTSNVQPNANAATATGAANNTSGTASASINAATGTGTASNPASNVQPNASAATGTGAASNAKTSVAPTPSVASGTGTAYNPVGTPVSGAITAATGVGTSYNAGILIGTPGFSGASGTGTAGNTSTSISGTAGSSTGTGLSGSPASSLAVNASVASGTGQAYNATVNTAAVANAAPGVATGTGAAQNATCTISLGSSSGSGTGSANGSSGNVAPNATAGTATGAANNTTSTVNPTSNVATATGAAQNAGGTVSATVNVATGTGAAATSSSNVQVNASAGTGTGEAYAATATAASSVEATPTTAAGTGNTYSATASVSSSSTTGSGAGDSYVATTQLAANGEPGSGTGTGGNTSSSVSVNSAASTGTGEASDATVDASIVYMVNPEPATGTGSADVAAIALQIQALIANGTGAAFGISGTASSEMGVASGSAEAFDVLGLLRAGTLLATGLADAFNPALSVALGVELAQGTGIARNAHSSLFTAFSYVLPVRAVLISNGINFINVTGSINRPILVNRGSTAVVGVQVTQ